MVDGGGKRVQVLYFDGCPNHPETVELVRRVVEELGLDVVVEEVEIKDEDDAQRLRFLGSPSVHVDGVDVEPEARSSTAYAYACRTYGGGRGVPPRELVVAALQEPPGRKSDGAAWRAALPAVPALAALLLPVASCPACWPAYAGLIGSMGLGFLIYEKYLLPLAAGLLVLALGSLLHRAPERHGYGPFVVGAVASVVASLGKFAVGSDALLYSGVALLTGAAIWNGWPQRRQESDACERCATREHDEPSRGAA